VCFNTKKRGGRWVVKYLKFTILSNRDVVRLFLAIQTRFGRLAIGDLPLVIHQYPSGRAGNYDTHQRLHFRSGLELNPLGQQTVPAALRPTPGLSNPALL
jgi:hypothetical protein